VPVEEEVQRSYKIVPITSLNYCEYIKQKLEINVFNSSEKNINHCHVTFYSKICVGLLYFSYIEFKPSKV
jgi:hypothetical protein